MRNVFQDEQGIEQGVIGAGVKSDLSYVKHKVLVTQSPELAVAVTDVTLAKMSGRSVFWMPTAVGRAPGTSRGSSGNFFQVWTIQTNYYFFST